MEVSRNVIKNGKFLEIIVSLDNESGTLDLKAGNSNPLLNISPSGSIIQYVVKYPDGDDSAGQTCKINLGGAEVLSMDGDSGIAESLAEVFDRGILFSSDDSLELEYNVSVAVNVRLYIDLAPGR